MIHVLDRMTSMLRSMIRTLTRRRWSQNTVLEMTVDEQVADQPSPPIDKLQVARIVC